tara:strand:+ start:498 stop:722 length:225 start_codon:yes stop_codon:yes gene_type:complete
MIQNYIIHKMNDIIPIIGKYVIEHQFKNLKNILKLNFQIICADNLNAIEYLENNPDRIDWKYLSKNPNAIHLLE